MPHLSFGLHRGSGFWNSILTAQTGSAYTHVSIIFHDETLLEARMGYGVVCRRNLQQAREEEPVDVATVEVHSPVRGLSFAMLQVNKPCRRLDLLRFLPQDQDARRHLGCWFSSELAFVVAQKCGVQLLPDVAPWEVTPASFSASKLLTITPDPQSG